MYISKKAPNFIRGVLSDYLLEFEGFTICFDFVAYFEGVLRKFTRSQKFAQFVLCDCEGGTFYFFVFALFQDCFLFALSVHIKYTRFVVYLHPIHNIRIGISLTL